MLRARPRTPGSPAPRPGPSSPSAQGILGIKPDYTGLRIDPCIPKAWPGFTASRRFRGVTYQIEVRNPSGVCKGVKQLRLDGEDVDPRAPIPFVADGGVHQVEVILG